MIITVNHMITLYKYSLVGPSNIFDKYAFSKRSKSMIHDIIDDDVPKQIPKVSFLK